MHFPEDWNTKGPDRLWLYNLHYFDGLLASAPDERCKYDLVEAWVEGNPPATGVGWEPYPIALRVVNWIKWHMHTGLLSERSQLALTVMTRYLADSMEYHLLANHIFANSKALFFAGLFFDDEEAAKWLSTACLLLDEQIKEQFLADGGHFERSTLYHAILLEDLLDILNLAAAFEFSVPSSWRSTAESALRWQSVMTRPDDVPPLFNDAAYGISSGFNELRTFGEALELAPPAPVSSGLHDLPASGYFRYEGESFSVFGDAGDIGPEYQPGHGHCDTLSFELFAHGKPIIVDTGVSTYNEGKRRYFERGTAAHNTVQVEDMEQSEIWGAFRVDAARMFLNAA